MQKVTIIKFLGIYEISIPVYRIKKMKCKEEYVNEISRFSNRF